VFCFAPLVDENPTVGVGGERQPGAARIKSEVSGPIWDAQTRSLASTAAGAAATAAAPVWQGSV